jgi:hypothetical protein
MLSLPILEGQVRTDLQAPEGVCFRAFEHGGKLYLIAGSGGQPLQQAAITGLGLSGTFEVLGENRSIPAVRGTLKDHFEPYTAHVYIGPATAGKKQ